MIIGMCGYKGHGKDSCGEILASTRGFVLLSFAAPIKAMLMEGLRLSREQVYGSQVSKETVDPRYGVTPRHMMQTLGTEWGRQLIAPDIWVKAAIERAKDYAAEGTSVVLTDVRFPNEAKAIREAGGQIWAVLRPGYAIDTSHESEAHTADLIHEAEQLIFNSGGLPDLVEAVTGAYRSSTQ